jgi:hypothetical protein
MQQTGRVTVNSFEQYLRSLWNNSRDISDETGFRRYSNQMDTMLSQQLRAARTHTPSEQVRREVHVEQVTAKVISSLLDGLAGGGRPRPYGVPNPIENGIRALIRTSLYGNNTSRR